MEKDIEKKDRIQAIIIPWINKLKENLFFLRRHVFVIVGRRLDTAPHNEPTKTRRNF